jgi:hypothetical protein
MPKYLVIYEDYHWHEATSTEHEIVKGKNAKTVLQKKKAELDKWIASEPYSVGREVSYGNIRVYGLSDKPLARFLGSVSNRKTESKTEKISLEDL